MALFKKGDKSDPGNYRSVSLTGIACKMMEKLVRNQIVEHMKRNELFSKKQFGFVSGRSMTLQLLLVLDQWTEILDNGSSIDSVYMDFMKTFDKVPHRRLKKKGTLWHWRKNTQLGSGLFNRQKTESFSERNGLYHPQCNQWNSTRQCTWTDPVCNLHKRHARLSSSNNLSLCQRYQAI